MFIALFGAICATVLATVDMDRLDLFLRPSPSRLVLVKRIREPLPAAAQVAGGRLALGSRCFCSCRGPLELAFLLFPTGRLAGPRWRWLAWAIIIANAVNVLAFALRPGPLDAHAVDNPLGVAALASATGLLAALLPVFMLGALLSLCSPLARLPGARGVEREQIKWVGSAGMLLVIALLLSGVLRPLGLAPAIADFVSSVMYALGVVGIPVAMGVAILRYRLYDIEVIIRRTLIYGRSSRRCRGRISVGSFSSIGPPDVHLRIGDRGRRLHAAHGRAVPAAPFARAERRRSALLPLAV